MLPMFDSMTSEQERQLLWSNSNFTEINRKDSYTGVALKSRVESRAFTQVNKKNSNSGVILKVSHK